MEKFRELFEMTSASCFKYTKFDDYIVLDPKENLYGVFKDIDMNSKKVKKMEDVGYVFYKADELEDLIASFVSGEIIKSKEGLCKDIIKFVKRNGRKKDFETFTPDSKGQTYMKFESLIEEIDMLDEGWLDNFGFKSSKKFKEVLNHLQDYFNVDGVKETKLDGDNALLVKIKGWLSTSEIGELEDIFTDFDFIFNRNKNVLAVVEI
jgi:hypothetical protein